MVQQYPLTSGGEKCAVNTQKYSGAQRWTRRDGETQGSPCIHSSQWLSNPWRSCPGPSSVGNEFCTVAVCNPAEAVVFVMTE